MHALRTSLALLLSTLVMLALPTLAFAEQLSAPISRGGNVGTATTYFGVANGWAVLDPKIVKFKPPVNGERYSAWVRLRAGCDGAFITRSSKPRTARLTGLATMRLNGLIKECHTTGTSVELRLFVRRVSTGAIVGRSLLFSAG